MPKRTYQPNKKRAQKKHGFLKKEWAQRMGVMF